MNELDFTGMRDSYGLAFGLIAGELLGVNSEIGT